MKNLEKNPFAQSEAYVKVMFTMPEAAASLAENGFDGVALAVSGFEVDEPNKIWNFELLCEPNPDMVEIERRILLLATLVGMDMPKITVEPLVQQDWLAQVSRQFPPLEIGRFYVHGNHVPAPTNPSIMAIQVEAGAAFGSGEHGTTRCCLEALDWLAKTRSFRNILDMGCGSGILAIAAAKLWRAPVLAVDIDAVAVQVTQENVRINRVPVYVTSAVSDGYASEKVQKTGPYDLIVSNILARPLVAFAPQLSAHLTDDGMCVLSGLLTSQEAQVRSAHMAQGLKLVKRFVHGEWCTLVLK